ncbi:transcriptional regulator [Pseudonocardia sp. TMWB2A]|uniref:helix-turn-helix transcriptional regulator n=1 Tax=Pseudonocardia sp. TMWB2A TaxID=687430 RepID=UPI00307D4D5A
MNEIIRMPTQLGHALRLYRKRAGLTQTQLATKSRLRQATVSQIENGHGATKFDTIVTILMVLDLELTIRPRTQSSPQDIEDIF